MSGTGGEAALLPKIGAERLEEAITGV